METDEGITINELALIIFVTGIIIIFIIIGINALGNSKYFKLEIVAMAANTSQTYYGYREMPWQGNLIGLLIVMIIALLLVLLIRRQKHLYS